MGGIVEHAPAEAARMLPVSYGRIQDPGMAQGLLLTALPGVEALGGEHVAVVLRDQQGLVHVGRDLALGLAAGVGADVGEIVVGVHILQETALLEIADTGGGTGGIQLAGQGIGPGVEAVIVPALVDPDAPEDDAGMVAVLQDHVLHVLQRLIDPQRIADVLPAGDLGEDQDASAVAFVQEVVALGIMGGAHRVAAQLLLKDPGILPLEALGGGVAHVGVALMAVQTSEEGLLAVEVEAVGTEFDGPEAEFDAPGIQHLAVLLQGHPADVAHGPHGVPGLHPGTGEGHALAGLESAFGDDVAALGHFRFHGAAVHAYGGGLDADRLRVGGGDEDVFQIALFPDVQPDLPVKTAVGQIIDHEAEGRHQGVLGGVQLDCQDVLDAERHRVGDLSPEARVAAPVVGHFPAVHVDGGDVGRAVELQEDPFAPELFAQGQHLAVAADHLVGLVVRIVEGQLPYRVGEPHRLAVTFAGSEAIGPLLREYPIIAKTDHEKPPPYPFCAIIHETAPYLNLYFSQGRKEACRRTAGIPACQKRPRRVRCRSGE